jgi:hypothetical protein
MKGLGSQSVSGSGPGSGSGGQVAVQSVFTMIDVLTSWRSKANYKSTRRPQKDGSEEGKLGAVFSLSPPSGLHPFGSDPNPFGRCVTALLAAVPKGSLGRCYSLLCLGMFLPPSSILHSMLFLSSVLIDSSTKLSSIFFPPSAALPAPSLLYPPITILCCIRDPDFPPMPPSSSCNNRIYPPILPLTSLVTPHRAALRIKAYARALRYFEMHARETYDAGKKSHSPPTALNPSPSLPPISCPRNDGSNGALPDLDEDQLDSLAEVFSHMDDPDSLQGVQILR